MARCILAALILDAAMRGLGQQAPAQPAAPTDPRILLTSAAKYYDFSSADLKPWHLKATYRLYDLAGNPTAEGTWEYWWASPKVHRSTWSRAGSERTDWQTAAGTLYRKESGEPLKHFERSIEGNLLSPLPPQGLVDSGRLRLDLKIIHAGSTQLACATTTLQWVVDGKPQAPASGTPGYYCFDESTRALRMTYSNSITTEFSRLVKTQERYLGEEMAVSIDKKKAFSLSVEKIDGISAADPALKPDADAVSVRAPVDQLSADSGLTTGSLVKKSQPVYPVIAKASHIQGTVIVAGTIGKDGKVRDLEVLASPSPLLTASALDSVKHWEYKPYVLDGAPVEVDTVINVTYALSP